MIEHTEGKQNQEEPPVWLRGLLTDVQLPPELDRRSRVASRAAFAIDRMRRERLHHTISELPLDRYIRGLAALAGVTLADIQQTLNLPDWGKVDRNTAPLLARVARLIGLTAEETSRFARWTFLGNIDEMQSDALLVMCRGEPVALSLDQALEQKERQYSEERRADLEAVLAAIRSEFDRGE